MITLSNITKKYKSKKKEEIIAINNINLNINETGFICILGKSGSGKTTLLNILGALDNFDNGQMKINNINTEIFKNRDWDNYRGKYIGFIFQDFNLLEELNVRENIALALEMFKYSKKEINNKVEEVLKEVDLVDFGNRMVYELSGGQKQRVAIARALIKNPYLILADEPTGNLDSETSIVILNCLKEISKEKLVIMVTHDKEYASKYADRIIELKDGNLLNDSVSFYEEQPITNFIIEKNTPHFPLNYSFKLALNSLLNKKIKLFFTFILFIMSIIMMSFTLLFTTYNFANTMYQTFKMNDIGSYNFQFKEECIYSDCIIKNNQLSEDISLLQDKYSYINIYQVYAFDDSPNLISFWKFKKTYNPNIVDVPYTYSQIVNNVILFSNTDTNLSLEYGIMPQSGDEVIITDYIAEMLIFYGIINVDNIEDTIGQKIYYNDDELTFKISGIINTNYEDYLYINSNTDLKTRNEYDFYKKHNFAVYYLNIDNVNYIKNNLGNYSNFISKVKYEGKVILSDNENNNIKLIETINNMDYLIASPASDSLYRYNQMINSLDGITLFTTLFISIFTGLLIYTFISNSIELKKKDIGILRSLGLTGRDCSKIFIIEGLIINVIVLIVSFSISNYLIGLINNRLNYILDTKIAYLNLNIINIAIIIFFSFFITAISSYLPNRKITLMKPIDAIKNK